MSPSKSPPGLPCALPPRTSSASVPASRSVGRCQAALRSDDVSAARSSRSSICPSVPSCLSLPRTGSQPRLHAEDQPCLETVRAAAVEIAPHPDIDDPRIHDVELGEQTRSALSAPDSTSVDPEQRIEDLPEQHLARRHVDRGEPGGDQSPKRRLRAIDTEEVLRSHPKRKLDDIPIEVRKELRE